NKPISRNISHQFSWPALLGRTREIWEKVSRRRFDRYYVQAWAIMCWCAVAFHYMVHMNTDRLVIGSFRDLIATREHFFELNPKYTLSKKWKYYRIHLRKLIEEVVRIWHLVRFGSTEVRANSTYQVSRMHGYKESSNKERIKNKRTFTFLL